MVVHGWTNHIALMVQAQCNERHCGSTRPSNRKSVLKAFKSHCSYGSGTVVASTRSRPSNMRRLRELPFLLLPSQFHVTGTTSSPVASDVETSFQGTSLQNNINMTQDVTPSEPLFGVTSLSSFRDDRAIGLPDASADLPQDQLRMIENIRALISELAVEKEELVQALRIESSNCSKMKELNKDLSQKLEAQTQRLEFLTAQRMDNESHLVKPMDNHGTHDMAEYADEGDEVII